MQFPCPWLDSKRGATSLAEKKYRTPKKYVRVHILEAFGTGVKARNVTVKVRVRLGYPTYPKKVCESEQPGIRT